MGTTTTIMHRPQKIELTGVFIRWLLEKHFVTLIHGSPNNWWLFIIFSKFSHIQWNISSSTKIATDIQDRPPLFLPHHEVDISDDVILNEMFRMDRMAWGWTVTLQHQVKKKFSTLPPMNSILIMTQLYWLAKLMPWVLFNCWSDKMIN